MRSVRRGDDVHDHEVRAKLRAHVYEYVVDDQVNVADDPRRGADRLGVAGPK
jgi:hypothetical protein